MVVVPLMLLLFGIIQFGFIFAAYMTVRNATVITARWMTLQRTTPPTNKEIQAFAKLQVEPLLNSKNVTAVNVTQTNVTSGVTNTSVQIQYKLSLIIPWVVHGTNAPGTYLVKATTIMM